MPDNKIVVTKEQIQKAMACETAEELMELAKEVGIELTGSRGVYGGAGRLRVGRRYAETGSGWWMLSGVDDARPESARYTEIYNSNPHV